MKITFILPEPNLSGGVRVVAIYAVYLQRLGHKVTIVSKARRWKTKLRLLIESRGMEYFKRTERSHLDNIEVERKIALHSGPIVDSDVPDADVVIATWWQTAPWVNELSPAKGKKLYFIQHDDRVWYPNDEHRSRQVAATWRLPMHRIVVSQWIADVLMQEGVTQSVLIPNGVDTANFYAFDRSRNRNLRVGFMYSRNPSKGSDIAIKAISLAKNMIPQLEVRVFGARPPTRRGILPSFVKFELRPAQKRIREIYASCDAWLFASRLEGFGLPILEAMACKTPVIGTPAGAAPELLTSGGGVLVKPENPEDMAKAIVNMSQLQENHWKKMSEAAHATAKLNTWDVGARRLEDAIKRHLSQC